MEVQVAKKSAAKVSWVAKAAFVMPVLPASLKIDPVVAGYFHMLAFLELSDDEAVDPDWAIEAMEHVGYYVIQGSPEARAALADQAARVAVHARKEEWPQEAIGFFERFMENFGIRDDE